MAVVLVVLIAITAAGCGGQAPTAAEACPPVQVLAPDGSQVDLTGEWSGNDSGLYYIKQIDSCVWWSGVSNFVDQGQYPGQEWIMTFKGHVNSEGVLAGDFVDVKGSNPGAGTMTIELRPEQVNGVQVINLYRTAASGHQIGVTFWERHVAGPSAQPSPDQSPPPGESVPPTESPPAS